MTKKEAIAVYDEIRLGLVDAYAPFKGEKSRRLRVRLSPAIETAFWKHLWPDDYDGRLLGGVEAIRDSSLEKGWEIDTAAIAP